MLKDEQGAKDMIDKMKFPGETAASYYARRDGICEGNRNEALSWIKSADALFRRERNLFFYDSLADLGWVEKDCRNSGRSALVLPARGGGSKRGACTV